MYHDWWSNKKIKIYLMNKKGKRIELKLLHQSTQISSIFLSNYWSKESRRTQVIIEWERTDSMCTLLHFDGCNYLVKESWYIIVICSCIASYNAGDTYVPGQIWPTYWHGSVTRVMGQVTCGAFPLENDKSCLKRLAIREQ